MAAVMFQSIPSVTILPGKPSGIRPKLVPGPPGFDLIKCAGGPGFDRGGEVAKKSMKEDYYYPSHRLIASVYNNRLCLNKRAGIQGFLKSK